MNLACAVYARYSTDKQNPLSIEDQVRKSHEYAARQGWRVLQEHTYADKALTGDTDDRPGLHHLLEAAASLPRTFDVILIEDTSRLSRDLGDSLRITKQLKFDGVRVVFVSQGIDSDSEQFEVLLATHGIVDSLYIRELAKKVYRGMEGRALKGLHTGGRCFGYRNQPIEDPGKTDSYGRPVIVGVRLVVEEAEAETVRRIFKLYASGNSLKRIAKLLNAKRVASPRPQTGRISRSWCPSSIRGMLRNDRYRGMVFWGKTRKVRVPKTGKRIKRQRAPTEWIMQELPEQRIVSDELWEQVDQRREQVKRLYANAGRKAGLLRGRTASLPYLFSGLLRCGQCGASLTIVSGRGKNRTASYGCPLNAQRGEIVCSNSLRIRRDVLEKRLLEKLQTEVLRPEVVEYTLERFEKELLKALDNLGGELERMRRQKRKLEVEINRLAEGLAAGSEMRPPAVIIAKINEREQELRAITDQLLASQPGSVQARLNDIRSFVLSRLADLHTLLNSDVMMARTELANHVQAIAFHPKDGSYKVSGTWDLIGDGRVVHPGPPAPTDLRLG